jgi:serine O-acetyltransferase
VSTERERWRVDRAGYPSGLSAWIDEPALWAVATYRLGRWALHRRGLSGRAARAVHRVLHLLMKISVNIELPPTVEIGPGLRIFHQSAITVGGGAKIGAHCRMRQGVTIGVRERGGAFPVLGDDVFIGPYAQILGGVHVGDGAHIGALSVVLADVPAGATVAGAPARPIEGR